MDRYRAIGRLQLQMSGCRYQRVWCRKIEDHFHTVKRCSVGHFVLKWSRPISPYLCDKELLGCLGIQACKAPVGLLRKMLSSNVSFPLMYSIPNLLDSNYLMCINSIKKRLYNCYQLSTPFYLNMNSNENEKLIIIHT
jgi:hypothetical protein